MLAVASNGALTLARVVVLIVMATLVWVPIGVAVGLHPRLAEKVQPIAQFLAAFPADLLFPVAVFLIVRFHLAPAIWLTPLMILGTQWYILFNVIAGASAFPTDLREAAASFRIHGWRWWRDVMLPGHLPVLRDRRHHRFRGLLECQHRFGSGELGLDETERRRTRCLHRADDRCRRLSAHRAGRRDDVFPGRVHEPPRLATAVCVC